MSISRFRELISKGVQQPNRIPNYLKRLFIREKLAIQYELYRRHKGLKRQKSMIHDLLDEDEFVLIVLDSCRFDTFQDEYSHFLTGNLSKVWSSANLTRRWMSETWNHSYDLSYVSTSPYTFDYAYEEYPTDFTPSETFDEVIDVIGQEWNPVLSTTPPEPVTDLALQHFANCDKVRAVVHYMQPHAPFIGDTLLLQWDLEKSEIQRLLESSSQETRKSDSVSADKHALTVEDLINTDLEYHEEREFERSGYKEVDEQVKDGDVTQQEVKKAYRDNLRHALPEVQHLVSHLDCTVVVTADHGEHLGEHLNTIPKYGHPDWTHPVLREVPWFVVDEESKGIRDRRDPELRSSYEIDASGSPTDDELSERLQALGYK